MANKFYARFNSTPPITELIKSIEQCNKEFFGGLFTITEEHSAIVMECKLQNSVEYGIVMFMDDTTVFTENLRNDTFQWYVERTVFHQLGKDFCGMVGSDDQIKEEKPMPEKYLSFKEYFEAVNATPNPNFFRRRLLEKIFKSYSRKVRECKYGK